MPNGSRLESKAPWFTITDDLPPLEDRAAKK
jgi:hypothetical protein